MKFTIRDLLWLTVVVALAAGWWIDHSRVDARYQRVRSAYRELTAWMSGGEWVRLGGGKSGDFPAFLPDP
jgi:hypothetical protein